MPEFKVGDRVLTSYHAKDADEGPVPCTIVRIIQQDDITIEFDRPGYGWDEEEGDECSDWKWYVNEDDLTHTILTPIERLKDKIRRGDF